MTYDTSVDNSEVESIIETMKKKYREEGMNFEEVSGGLKEIRGLISEETYAKQEIETKEDLEGFDSQIAQTLGQFYLQIKDSIKPIQNIIKKIPLADELGYYLYSANMPYSSSQYIAITTAAAIAGTLIMLIAGFFIGALLSLGGDISMIALLPVPFALAGGLGATMIMFLMPRQKAMARGNACSVELLFALRHMATELKAGIGLYKTLQAVTASDYGVLSEELARTITEIEEGTDTSVALKHLALRTQSRPLRFAINHMLRAMRVGGNLSGIMNEIAEDVSDDLKNKINSFSQKMNFFSVIFIFLCIVMPVAIMLLGAIVNSPLGTVAGGLAKAVPLTPAVMALLYLIIMPLVFVAMNVMIFVTQPKM